MENQYTVLIAEDEPASQFLYQEELEEMGFKVLKAENGLQVIAILEHKKVDLLLTDLKMPEMPAVELISYVCGNYPDLPVIVVSGHHQNILNNLEVRGQNVRAFFSKPVQMSEVKSKICEILGIGS